MIGADPHFDAGSELSEPATRAGRWRRKRVLLPGVVVMALLAGLAIAWFSRERIAGDVIQGQLDSYDIPATYEIERIGAQRQVLRNVVVGDPARPDLTVERAEITIAYRFGTPQIGRIALVRPRLYGRLVGGRVSFGTLDRAIYRDTGRPPGLPELDLDIQDGRALIRTPYGPVGAKLDGRGLLSDGFAGTLAVTAPSLAAAQCRASAASLFGRITSLAGQPRFVGPVRFAGLDCPGRQLALGRMDAQVDLTSDAAFASYTGRADIDAGSVRYADYRAGGFELGLRGNWKNGLLDVSHTLAARGVMAPQATATRIAVEGSLRTRNGFADLDLRSDVGGSGLRPGPSLQQTLTGVARQGEGTLLAPLARQFATALNTQSRDSTFTADLAIRRRAGATSVIVPRAELLGAGGARLLALSRVEAAFGTATPRLTGNIATGGPGLPQLTGRMERTGSGGTVFRLVMQPYTAESASLAVPELSVVQAPGGAIGFAGRVLASGPLPGGTARGLALPVSGRWAPDGSISLWRDCVDVRFDRLALANLTLERRGLRLCPPSGRAIVQSNARGLSIAAGAPSLNLAGSLGRTPIRLASGAVGFAYPGTMTARSIDVALGPAATASRFTVSNLTARLGGSDIAGTFDGADVRLAAVPLDLRDATGNWRYAGGVLSLTDGDFRLVDRQAEARFEPLIARDGTLRLADNIVTAEALLRNPATDRVVTEVDLTHNLAAGRGYANLTVPGILFDRQLQPVALSRRALGVIANARGTITGTGRIDWNPEGVTSTGAFSSEGIDFAAAFGPVKGARGTVRFTDLIGLTTAPGQTLQVASVNPGIEVTDGEVVFQLRGGQLLAVEGGSWPFMGGRLILRQVELNFGIEEERRYIFDIQGLDAATFIARFELPNIAATGTFDGTVPIVFDANGNGRVEGGLLTARPPGGNVSYVGDLTYKDLSTLANFAFDTLRSLDYDRMRIAIEGPLTGNIVTNVNIEGVRQGEGAKRNIITRALANLPIQFRINITAPFYQLITSFKSLRDPAAVRDPRELGLLSDDGTRLKPVVRGEDVPVKVEPEDIIPDEPPIQTKESEKMP
jgi:hypothetical protein